MLIPFIAALLILGVPSPVGIGALTDQLARQRRDFLIAEDLIAWGDRDSAAASIEALRDYPLYPYLRGARLTTEKGTASLVALRAFLGDHADTPVAHRLRRQWLDHLARAGRWEDFLTLYRPGGPTALRCHYLQGLLATGSHLDALDLVEPLWLVGHSQPPACDPVFAAWRAAGALTTELVWRRIELAMAAGNRRLARYLGRFLPAAETTRQAMAERGWLDLWLAVDQDPGLIEETNRFNTAHPRRPRVIAHGILKLADQAPRRAVSAWGLWRERIGFTAGDQARIHSTLGLALARIADERAINSLDQVPAGRDNLAFQEQRLRIALAREDWTKVANWIDQMPDGAVKRERWLYWRARAAEKLGGLDVTERYRRAAEVRGLWGFLAAERVGVPLNLTHRPVAPTEALVQLVGSPALRRIEELATLGRSGDLRREWDQFIANLDPDGLAAAALIAHHQGWHDRAIRCLAEGDHWDDLALRFPIRYIETIGSQAAMTGLPESWILAVIRQESAFAPNAGSQAGAVGLMQLMPATARWIAKRLGKPMPTRVELLDPTTNIALGAGYLAYVSQRFDGHPALATAAYNAGPGRVQQWLPTRPQEADLWVATIPYQETREYVQRVLAYRLIYAKRLGLTDGPVSAWLGPIP